MDRTMTYTAFAGDKLVGSGDVETMLRATKGYLKRHRNAQILIFEDQTGKQIDFDFRGSAADVLERLGAHPHFAGAGLTQKQKKGPGRPKLGVVSREVSLLPRHWDWLELQPSGISAALRRLVDEARKREPAKDKARATREAASRVMWAVAGNYRGFEEASRALFAKDLAGFTDLIAPWPADIRTYLEEKLKLAEELESQES